MLNIDLRAHVATLVKGRLPRPGRPFLLALLFTAFLTIWEAALFQINYYDFYIATTMRGVLPWNERAMASLLFVMAGSLCITLAYCWVALRSPWWVRAVAWLLFALAVFYEYGYQRAAGRNSTPEDFLMAARYRDTALFTDAILLYVNLRAVVPVIIFGALLARPLAARPQATLRPPALLLVLSSAAIFYSAIFYVWSPSRLPIPMNSFPTPSLSAFLRTATFGPWKVAKSYGGPRDTVDALAASPPANNVVIIVDESVRGDHLSINGYGRSTTPYLDELASRGNVYTWGVAVSGATCSLESNNLLLTGFYSLPDKDQAVKRWPSIFQYARAMGYRTFYLDASSDMLWNGTPGDLNAIDRWENAESFARGEGYDADRNMGARLNEILTSSTGNFIWLNKRGVHFYYNNAFPRDNAAWLPVQEVHSYGPQSRQELVNSYDSGLRYNLEGFFRAALPDTALLSNTVILYTSDHGQTLAENGEDWAHCRDSHNEANVPLLLIARPGLGLDTTYAASHANIFASLLDLMGVPDGRRPYSYSPSLFRVAGTDSQPRYYYSGPLDGSDNAGYHLFDKPTPGQ